MGCGSSKSTDAIEPTLTARSEKQSGENNSNESEKEWTPFELWMLGKHNTLRSLHKAPALNLNKDLCNMAQSWADHLASQRMMEHSDKDGRQYQGKTCGENLAYFQSTGTSYEESGYDPTQSWYDEISDYDFDDPGFKKGTGHFTQVVWDGSQQLGVAKAEVQDGDSSVVYFVANYFPAGNVITYFEDNVQRAST